MLGKVQCICVGERYLSMLRCKSRLQLAEYLIIGCSVIMQKNDAVGRREEHQLSWSQITWIEGGTGAYVQTA